jgi:ribonuclease BN (tRNA processing enzyme)
VKLTVLGCSTPLPQRDNPCSGYLISGENSTILLDCGSGIFPVLVDYINPGTLSAIWISHMHPDHSADLITLANWALNATNAPKVRVLGPLGWDVRLNGFISNDASRDLVREIFDVEYLDDGLPSSIGEFTLVSRLVHHSVITYGVRISSGDSTFAYSGDTGPCRALEQLADNVDILLCEAGSEKPTEYHMTIHQAHEAARKAKVGRLLVTHIPHGHLAGGLPNASGITAEIVNAGDEWPVLPNLT